MLQRLQIVLAQVQAGNTAKNLLNEICQIICTLYRGKERNYEKSLEQSNEFNKVIKQNGYYIYEFCKQ